MNTSPLVWGMLHGPQRGAFDLEFRIPSECADRLASGGADIGIVPCFELTKQDLDIVPGAGIACHGPVRSILLVSKRPANEIRTLAADSSSRTSVQLARVILQRRYGVRPEMMRRPPELATMLEAADAALVIGDPALHIDIDRPLGDAVGQLHVHDLGGEWVEMTGLPMVFAVWAGRKGVATPEVVEAFQGSCRFGKKHIDEVAAAEGPRRGFTPEFARDYLTRSIVHELGPREYEGMELFLRYARECAGERPPAATGV